MKRRRLAPESSLFDGPLEWEGEALADSATPSDLARSLRRAVLGNDPFALPEASPRRVPRLARLRSGA